MSWSDTAAFVAALGTIGSSVGVIYVAAQLVDGRRFMKATLINELEREFRDHYPTYDRLLPGADWSPTGPGPSSSADLCNLEAYLEFFEKLSLIMDTRAMDLETVDRLYAFRFFLALNNPHVEKLVHREEPYWSALLALYEEWLAYRNARNLPTPNTMHRFKTIAQAQASLLTGET